MNTGRDLPQEETMLLRTSRQFRSFLVHCETKV